MAGKADKPATVPTMGPGALADAGDNEHEKDFWKYFTKKAPSLSLSLSGHAVVCGARASLAQQLPSEGTWG